MERAQRRLVVRVGLSLLLCALVGLGLTISAAGAHWTKPDVTVVTTSAGTVEGRLRGTSSKGVELLVADGQLVIPWSAIIKVSLKAAGTSVAAGEGATRRGRI
jgi:hypothetical protein